MFRSEGSTEEGRSRLMKAPVWMWVVFFIVLALVLALTGLIVMSRCGVGIDTREDQFRSKRAHLAVMKTLKELPSRQLSTLENLEEGDAATSYALVYERFHEEGERVFDGLAEITHILNLATSVKECRAGGYPYGWVLNMAAANYFKLIKNERDFEKRREYLGKILVILSHLTQGWSESSVSGVWELDTLHRYLFALTNFFSAQELEELGYGPGEAQAFYDEIHSQGEEIGIFKKRNWNIFTWRLFKP